MTKMRVYEYAKKNNLTSKDVIEKLKQLNIEVSNHMTTIEENVIRQLDQSFGYTKPVTEKENKNSNDKREKSNHQVNSHNKHANHKPAQKMKPAKKAPAKVKPVPKKVKPGVIADQDELDDVVAPTKEKVKTAPKTKEGKKYDQEFKSKEKKAFNRNKNKGKGKAGNKKIINKNKLRKILLRKKKKNYRKKLRIQIHLLLAN